MTLSLLSKWLKKPKYNVMARDATADPQATAILGDRPTYTFPSYLHDGVSTSCSYHRIITFGVHIPSL